MLTSLFEKLCNKNLFPVDENFSSLLRDIDAKVNEDGLLRQVDEAMEKTQAQFRNHRRKYLEGRLIMTGVENVLLELSKSKEMDDQESLSRFQRLTGVIESFDMITEFREHFRLIDERLVEDANFEALKTENHLRDFRRVVAPALERMILQQVQTMHDYLRSQEIRLPKVGFFDESSPEEEVLGTIASLVSSLALFRREIASIELEYTSQLQQCFVVLMRLTKVLAQLLRETKVGRKREMDNVRQAYLLSMCKTSSLKLAVLKYEILTKSYTNETVPIFWGLRQDMDARLERYAQRNRDMRQKLEQYSKMSSSFLDVVQDYESVLEKMETKRYCLEELEMNGKV